MRILLVEDDRFVREGLRRALQTKGHSVAAAANVAEAVAALNDSSPDVLVCDWQLDDDDGDGVDVARLAAEKGGCRIVMLTARELDDLRERAGNVPVKVFLRKPVALSSLLEAIA